MLPLTHDEVQALEAILEEAIVKSKEDDGDDDGGPVFHEVDCVSVDPFGDAFLQSDVYDSLAKKGLIACSAMEEFPSGKVTEFVCITPSGLEALKSAKGVH